MGFEEITGDVGDVRELDFWTVSQYLFGHATDSRLAGRPAVPLPVAPRLEGRQCAVFFEFRDASLAAHNLSSQYDTAVGAMLRSKGPEIRCYDYVNHPYERVRDTLRHALTVFQSATKAAAYRAQSIAVELHVDVGGIGVKTDFRQKRRGERP